VLTDCQRIPIIHASAVFSLCWEILPDRHSKIGIVTVI
jgi:hypothetical protein